MNPLAEFRMLNEKIDELEAKLSRAEKIIKIQGEALIEIQVLQYLGKNNQGKMYIQACQAIKEVEELRNE